MATTIKTTRPLGIVGKTLIGLAGTLASIFVTMQIKKQLEKRGISTTDDALNAIDRAGLSPEQIKSAVAAWLAATAQNAADKASSVASKAEEKI